MDIVDKYEALQSAELIVTGRLVDASNATLFAHVVFDQSEVLCIYKPIAGERPLWDFIDGYLAHRELAAFEVSRNTGWNIVPYTILREGPYGVGMVQEWISIDKNIDLSELFSQDHPRLRVMALFDAVINNTDRKIGHLLPVNSDIVYGCDHGVTFHSEDKLRTVLWQWAGEELFEEEISQLSELRNQIDGDFGKILATLLTQTEIWAMKNRIQKLLDTGIFPEPNPNWPAVPWPAF